MKTNRPGREKVEYTELNKPVKRSVDKAPKKKKKKNHQKKKKKKKEPEQIMLAQICKEKPRTVCKRHNN